MKNYNCEECTYRNVVSNFCFPCMMRILVELRNRKKLIEEDETYE